MALFKGKQIESLPASKVVTTPDMQFVTAAEKTGFADKYTKNEIDNKISQIQSGIEWLASVPTFADLATTYPNPGANSVAIVDSESTAYRYDQSTSTWVLYPTVAYNKATQTEDGLMSKEDKTKLDGVEAGANNYVHPVNHSADMITETETKKFVTAAEKAKINSMQSSYLKTIHIAPSADNVTNIPTGITTNGTGQHYTNGLNILLAVNGIIQDEGAGEDFTLSESASNEIIITWFNKDFTLETTDKLSITYMQLA